MFRVFFFLKPPVQTQYYPSFFPQTIKTQTQFNVNPNQ